MYSYRKEFGFNAMDYLLVFIPISILLVLVHANPVYVFITSIIAIVPIAKSIGKATENLALQTTPTIGALMNATFGNVIELIIAVFAIQAGLLEVVKASITGSIIGNLLLLIGLSMFAGGLRYKEQKFNSESAGVSSTMLIIALTGLAIPTIYSLSVHGPATGVISLAVSVVMAVIYILGLVFTLFTHKHLFDVADDLKRERIIPSITKRKAVLMLIIFTALAAVQSETFVSAIEPVSEQIGLTQTFIGVVIIAIITNIAEKINAVGFALKNKIDISIEIGTNSATQIALFVVPLLVLISSLMAKPLTLVFPVFELAAAFFGVFIINYLSSDGKCNWLEGAQLVTVYMIIVIAFYFV
jgi:Ca2+:H+ antiporter